MSQFVKSTTSKYKFGAHVSTAGGISNSILNANKIGCNSFAMFLKSPRKWDSPPIPDEEIKNFKEYCTKYSYDPMKDILPHGHYFINLANPDKTKSDKAYGQLIDELRRCEQLGIGLYNLHPGSALKGGDHELQLKQLASYLSRAINETKFVKIVLENMAGKDNLIGNRLEDLKNVIDLIENKERVGVCVDTCHAFASGYDISNEATFNEFWNKFDDIIGLKYLAAMHLNDSKAPRESNQDLHEKLGQGFLGLEVFRLIGHCKHLQGIPLILETPHDNNDNDGYGYEIEMLQWLETIDDADNKELIAKNVELQKLGSKTRKDQMAKFEKKQIANAKSAAKGKRKLKTAPGNDIMSQMRNKRSKPEPKLEDDD